MKLFTAKAVYALVK